VKAFHAVRHCSAEENPIQGSGVLEAAAKLAQTLV